MLKIIARVVSVVFHPLLIPTIGFAVLLYSGFYFSMLSWEAKRFILLVVFFTTAVLPVVVITLLAFNPRFDPGLQKSPALVMHQLATAVFYYLGYHLLARMNVFPVFRIMLIAGALVIVVLSIIDLKWKLSSHMAGMGGILGAVMALSFRLGINPVWSISAIVLLTGMVGSSRMILGDSRFFQVVSGFGIGFLVLYLVVYYS